ncbi:anaerobic ribonucleoside-triphosphate reductase activating protein [Thiolapillus sp.]
MPDSPLRVGGFVPFTSIDYPGELAAVVFCQGCPWRCGYCHNPHLLPARGHQMLDWKDVLAQLEQRQGFLDAVVFSGGEPTAQAGLPQAIRDTKCLGYKIGLHTAGCYPERLEKLLPLLDWIGLDIKELPQHYESLTGVPTSGARAWESLALALRSGVPLQVRTTLDPGIPAQHISRLCRLLKDMGVQDHKLQEYRPTDVPAPNPIHLAT